MEVVVSDPVFPETNLYISGRILDPKGRPAKKVLVNGWDKPTVDRMALEDFHPLRWGDG